MFFSFFYFTPSSTPKYGFVYIASHTYLCVVYISSISRISWFWLTNKNMNLFSNKAKKISLLLLFQRNKPLFQCPRYRERECKFCRGAICWPNLKGFLNFEFQIETKLRNWGENIFFKACLKIFHSIFDYDKNDEIFKRKELSE